MLSDELHIALPGQLVDELGDRYRDIGARRLNLPGGDEVVGDLRDLGVVQDALQTAGRGLGQILGVGFDGAGRAAGVPGGVTGGMTGGGRGWARGLGGLCILGAAVAVRAKPIPDSREIRP